MSLRVLALYLGADNRSRTLLQARTREQALNRSFPLCLHTYMHKDIPIRITIRIHMYLREHIHT